MSVSRLRSDNSGCDEERSLANDRVDQIPSIVVAYGAMRARLSTPLMIRRAFRSSHPPDPM